MKTVDCSQIALALEQFEVFDEDDKSKVMGAVKPIADRILAITNGK